MRDIRNVRRINIIGEHIDEYKKHIYKLKRHIYFRLIDSWKSIKVDNIRNLEFSYCLDVEEEGITFDAYNVSFSSFVLYILIYRIILFLFELNN